MMATATMALIPYLSAALAQPASEPHTHCVERTEPYGHIQSEDGNYGKGAPLSIHDHLEKLESGLKSLEIIEEVSSNFRRNISPASSAAASNASFARRSSRP